ncbi:MAG TPA: hypothetical protein VFE59_33145, partial [Trebonia sp.]|nr:hypothetical protein [Trebonia sp.]
LGKLAHIGHVRPEIYHIGEGGAVRGQDRGNTVHNVLCLAGHAFTDDFAVGVDGDLARELQKGLIAKFNAGDVGVLTERGGNGRGEDQVVPVSVA